MLCFVIVSNFISKHFKEGSHEKTLTKQTHVTKEIRWNGSLKDENGTEFAVMAAVLDVARPLGNTTFTVYNQTAFEANKTDAQAAYAELQAAVEQVANETTLVTIETEGEETENNGDAE